MSLPRLFLIDAHALCYRSFFAIKGLSNSTGQATNAVYGFISTLRKILKDFAPEYVAVCFDTGKRTRRQEKFTAYKIQRPSMPDDLISQIPIIKDVVSAYNLTAYEKDGYEADDIIAAIVHKMHRQDLEVVIVSDDKDMCQLVNSKIKMYSISKETIMGEDEVKAKFGFEPAQIVDYLALVGDSVDNIPGVKGIGEVTAKKLIKDYGGLENILKNVEHLKPPKVQEKIAEQKEMAILSKELATLEVDIPVEIHLEDMQVKLPDAPRLFKLFKELEFKRLADEFSGHMTSDEKVEFETIEDAAAARALQEQIIKDGEFAFLWECEPETTTRRGMFVATKDGKVYSLPKHLLSACQKIFTESKLIKITHNSKLALKVLAALDITLEGEVFDVMLAGYLLMPSQASYDLEALIWNCFKKSVLVEQSPAAAVSNLAKLYPVMFSELKEKSLLKLFEDIEMPLCAVLFKMEEEGVCLDTKLLSQLSAECEEKLGGLMKKLYELAGGELNLNSPKQLSQFLFERLKLPVIKKTKTGFSTDEGVLTKLAEKHEAPNLILEYRQITKLKSTYIDALPQLINPKTGRVHATFNQVGTETGRLSSNNPNLQNIPIRAELGRRIRQAFVPSKKENLLISADYSQVELRILAHWSGDEALAKAFESDDDIHRYTAALIFEVKEKDVTPKMRDTAKRVNFGIIYGMSSFGLSKDLNIPGTEAQEFIDKYFLRYPKVKKFMDDQITTCQDRGYVLTFLNRRRYLPEILSPNMAVRQFAERQAINTPVQGSAADLIKLAMINIQKEIEKRNLKSRMIITVHDELVFDCVPKEKDELVELIRDRMEHSWKLSVPIKVSVKVGKNWLEVEEV